jgi:hypothetical protein
LPIRGQQSVAVLKAALETAPKRKQQISAQPQHNKTRKEDSDGNQEREGEQGKWHEGGGQG